MREIFFRGFHPCDGPETIVVNGEKIKGRWVEGLCFLQDHDGNAAIGDKIDTKSVYQYQKEWILITGYGAIGLPVIADTVGQSTGLTDSTGRKVFEDDVLKFTDEPNSYEWTGRIEFGNPNGGYTWGYQIVHLSGPKPNIDTLCWFDMEEGGAYSEVIGTVFDGEAKNA